MVSRDMDDEAETWTIVRPAVVSHGGIVAAQHIAAARAGAEVLENGGNAVDAAVASALAHGIVEPWNSGIGGGGQLIFADAGSGGIHAVDFLPVAPAGLDPGRYPVVGETSGSEFGWPAVEDDRNVLGYEAICVPGAVDGLGLALERFGRKTLAEVLQPSIRLANRGLPLDARSSLLIAAAAPQLERFEASRAVYLPSGRPPLPEDYGGTRFLQQAKLAATYRRLADAGRRDFYEGEIADAMAADLAAGGSAISGADLRAYRAAVVEPLVRDYHGHRCYAVGGTSGGPMFVEALRRLEGRVAPRPGAVPGAVEYVNYADVLLSLFEERLAGFGHLTRSGHTTNLSVVDRDGNMVSVTNTVGVDFGSKVVLPRTGIVMNSAVNNFDPRPGRANSIAPRQRPVLNICPVILTSEDRPQAALGASGGRRIIPAVVQLTSFKIDAAMALEQAFATPRIDVSRQKIVCDARLPQPVRQALARLAPVAAVHQRATNDPFAFPTGVSRDWAAGVNFGMAHIHSPSAAAVDEHCGP